MLYLGIDPGMNGAAVLITHAQQVVSVLKFKGATEKDIAEWFASMFMETSSPRESEEPGHIRAVIERVHSMPKQGVASTFKFGMSYGFLRGMLISHAIPFEAVTPGVWQRKLGCLSGGDKNKTKSRAQELFPHEKWTHATADAVLLSEFCRRMHEGLNAV